MSLQRIRNELKEHKNTPNPFFTVRPISPDNLLIWKAKLRGPLGSPYEGGLFIIEIGLENHPYKTPNLRFITPIYHPNINSEGKMCSGLEGS